MYPCTVYVFMFCHLPKKIYLEMIGLDCFKPSRYTLSIKCLPQKIIIFFNVSKYIYLLFFYSQHFAFIFLNTPR